jgi:hypothetical protein
MALLLNSSRTDDRQTQVFEVRPRWGRPTNHLGVTPCAHFSAARRFCSAQREVFAAYRASSLARAGSSYCSLKWC